MLRFELRHYMYLPPYLSHALCHPSTGVPICLSVSPGVPASASLRRDKPPLTRLHRRATIYRPSGALISAGIRPQGIPYKLPFIEFLEMPTLYFSTVFSSAREPRTAMHHPVY